MSKEIKLKIAILDDSGKLVKIPQFIQKHINQIEKRWFEKMKKLDENYKEQIHELERRLSNCIEPKFKIGQEVFVIDWCGQLRNGYIYEVQTNSTKFDIQPLITYLVWFSGGYEDDNSENDYFEEKDIFATEEEAKAKLRGDER